MKNKETYQYPWRHNNNFQILIDGANYFSAMLNEIKKADNRILLEHYLFESGNTADIFINELCAAKNRGVEVFILLDDYGTTGLSDEDRAKLTSCGIMLSFYNPVSFFHFGRSLKRDHRKLLIVDERVAFIGGAGITDEFSPEHSRDYWHDVMLKVNGDILFDLIHSFNTIWQTQNPALHTQKSVIESTVNTPKNKARVLISSGSENNEIMRATVTHIRTSKKHVWLTSPYFISSWKIRRALRYAAKKGVDVRLILPGPHSDHKWVNYGVQRYYHRLLKANVVIYEFQPRFTHTKIILCDDWFTIGSSNLDRWNQFLNLDANIEIYDEQSNQQVVELFTTDFSRSKLIILTNWNARSLIQHIKEWASGIIISVLDFISGKFKR